MKIYIKCEFFRTIEVKISTAATVKSLKVQIESITGIPLEEQVICKEKSFILNNDQVLSEALIKPLSCLTLKHNLPPRSSSLTVQVCQTISNLRRFSTDNQPRTDHFENFFRKCREGDFDFVLRTLEESPEIVKIFSNEGWTCLHFAAFTGNCELIKLFLDEDADVNQLTRDKKWTALHLICIQGHIKALDVLLQNSHIIIDMEVDENATALHCACLNGSLEIVEMLLTAKANCTIENQLGQLPIDIATVREIKDLLSKYMGKLEEIPEFFEGPLNFRKTLKDLKGWGVLRPAEGTLMLYKSQKSFNSKGIPEKTFNVKEMNEIRRCKPPGISSLSSGCYFFMQSSSSGQKFYFYSDFEEIANHWVKTLFTSLLYRQSKSKKLEVTENLLLDFPCTPEISIYSFEVLDQIGNGSFSLVHLARKKDTDELFALKSMSKQFLIQKNFLKNAISECRVLSILNFPFIIRLHFCFKTARTLYMVLENCKFGSLATLLQRTVTIPNKLAQLYTAEIVLAIEYLHSLNILYRDLKPENLLICSTGHLKLADFGMVKENFNDDSLSKSFCGTPAYLSPEMLNRQGVTKKADIYAIGCVMYELLSGYPPHYSEKINIVFERISSAKVKFHENFDPIAKDLLEKLLNKSPTSRPGFTEIKNHGFFEGVNWEALMRGEGEEIDIEAILIKNE
jgi:hypothetical protein